MGNICRSPAAEIIFRHLLDEARLSDLCEIDSAGTIGFHAGKPPDARMAEHLQRRGYQVAGRSRQVKAIDLARFDLILTMDEENQEDLVRLDIDGEHRSKIVPFVNFLRKQTAERIPDPYYGGEAGFAHVLDLLEDGCAGLISESFGP